MENRYFVLIAVSIALLLFVGLLGMIQLGRRLGQKRDPKSAREGQAAAEGAVYALFGLLLAFSFSNAAERFDDRRVLIVNEANSIGTAYLRLDMLPAEAQPALRDGFRRYLDSRLLTYRKLPDVPAAREEFTRSLILQQELWRMAVETVKTQGVPPLILLPPLNEMFDLASTRVARTSTHPPNAIFAMLVALALVSAMLVGFRMAGDDRPSPVHTVVYAAVLSLVIYLVLDLEYPRLGFIRVDAADRALVEVREGMK